MTPNRIMVVEDSETQALKLCCLLEEQGWEPTAVGSAELALQQINQRLPDLIIADYHLPGMAGDELCRQIRMNIDTRSIPILLFTIDETQASQLRALESGADDYVPKSVDADILVLRTRALLRKTQIPSAIVGPGDAYFRTARLLAIDDSPTYLEFLTHELKSEGYKVELARSGVEGVKRVTTEEFDCVLVDLLMPEMDGVAVCKQLAEIRMGLNNPIVVLMLTASENKDDMTLGLEAGADDFVGKSSDMAVLKGRIRALLRRKFFQEENQRILEELKNKELEAMRARTEMQAAEAKAAMASQLEQKAEELRRANLELQRENSERRRAEERLQHLNSQLEFANKELEAFSYSVSHDLRAPVRHIDGFVGLLRKSAGEALNERSKEHLDTISDSAKQMGVLIDDLLAFSRMGRAELQTNALDLNELVREVIIGLRAETKDRKIEWKIDPLPAVNADASLLRQVWINLVSNALKYSRQRPVARIEIGVNPESNGETGPVFFVRDNGTGFDMQYADRLFGVFQRLHTADEFEGTGIGLANVHRIVTRHGGRTWANAEVDKGATFYFSLPKSSAPKIVDLPEPGGAHPLSAVA